jgi:molybdopterin/thiamine biosynthesis adenylyltransferase/ubiquitin-protein ligase
LHQKSKQKEIEDALSLPLPESYRILLKDLRFDYMDMQENNQYKHHYATTALSRTNPPASKMTRLAQELADLSNSLPFEHTNSIFVRVDRNRLDLIKALIMGANATPYGHGAFVYDIFLDNNYPNEPPKMNLATTGGGPGSSANSVRFNPNLYNCGKVCLSLLGTWRGSSTENWDPKISTILQVLMSAQAIVMSEEVYFNEPGFESEAGTVEGDRKDTAYSNIVRYCNIKFCMLGQLRNPPKGFEEVIRRHFYLKKDEIMKEIRSWIEQADKKEASYTGLVHDHNYNWCKIFKERKTKYREMLVEIAAELEEEMNKLKPPSGEDIVKKKKKSKKKVKEKKKVDIGEGVESLKEIDMEDDLGLEEEKKQKELNVEDEEVKDRWSRYIGAMGIEAVAKQAAANIFLSGAGALGIEIAKNLVLAGSKSFTLHDLKTTQPSDLSGQFFLRSKDIGVNRALASKIRLQQLNYYVKVQTQTDPIPLTNSELDSFGMKNYSVIILTETDMNTAQILNQYCRENKIFFILANAYGPFCRIFNDFGEKFEVLDKDGEEAKVSVIENITNEEEGIVKVLSGTRHGLETDDLVLIQEYSLNMVCVNIF